MKWIAVVDDDVTNLNIAGQILSKNKMRVSAMKSGAALLKFMQDNRPDLILLDIAMPQMDGFEVLEKLRGYEKENSLSETPVIFLTADTDTATENRGFEMGVSDFIRKPFDPQILLKRIGNAVDKQEQINRSKEDATIDKLTGFLNKAAANEKLTVLCREKRGVLMMIDLDSFKLVNDIYGHEMGDKVLVSFAGCVKGSVPDAVYGRIGGDEFIVFAYDMHTAEEVSSFTKALNDEFSTEAKMLMGSDMEIPLGASVGAVFVPEHGTDYVELFKTADKLLYTVKQNGKHGHAVYGEHTAEEEQISGIREISMLLEERNIPNCALRLERESFMYVYRFVLRYLLRYHNTACKILFTVQPDEDAPDEIVEEFGEHVKNSLRKSDLMMKTGRDQYFVLLPEVKEESVVSTAERVISDWKIKHSDITVTYETEIVKN